MVLVMKNVTGGCLCGEVRYELDDGTKSGSIYSYHCSSCRFIPIRSFRNPLKIPTRVFTFEGGLREFILTSKKGGEVSIFYCKNCGENIFCKSSVMNNVIFLSLDTLFN